MSHVILAKLPQAPQRPVAGAEVFGTDFKVISVHGRIAPNKKYEWKLCNQGGLSPYKKLLRKALYFQKND